MKVCHQGRAEEALDLDRDALLAFLGGEEFFSGQIDLGVQAAELDHERVGRDRPAVLDQTLFHGAMKRVVGRHESSSPGPAIPG
jgi:hypothetical protein